MHVVGAVARLPHHLAEKEIIEMLNRRNALKLTAALAATQIVPSPVAAATPTSDPVKAIIAELRGLTSDQLEHLVESASFHLVMRGEFRSRFPYWAAGMGWIDWDKADAMANDPERQTKRRASVAAYPHWSVLPYSSRARAGRALAGHCEHLEPLTTRRS
jgi:hypothetical protein